MEWTGSMHTAFHGCIDCSGSSSSSGIAGQHATVPAVRQRERGLLEVCWCGNACHVITGWRITYRGSVQ